MTDKKEERFCCLKLSKDVFLLFGKIVFAVVAGIFSSIFPSPKKSVKDEVVLVTGAGRGLGRELALKFASLQSIVVLWDIDEKSVLEVQREIQEEGGRAHAYVCDVTDYSNVKKVGNRVQQEVGDVTILVNNAGILQNRPFADLETDKIKKAFEVNTIAHFWTIKFFLPRMLEMDKGHIVAVSSMGGLLGWIYMTDYCATKFAIVGMMEALEEELRLMAKGKTIHCTTVCPITFDTGLNRNPTSRLPWLMPIMTPEYTAATVVNAVQSNQSIITIPTRIYYPLALRRLFPKKVTQLILDFLEYCAMPNNPEETLSAGSKSVQRPEKPER